ncbi:MAG: flagellar export protein FliJ [Pseudomonadota bacterium]
MARSTQRLAPVADLAKHQQLQAEKALAKAQREVQSRTQMLTQLRTFRDGYDQGPIRAQVGARSMAALRDFECFLERLDQAIEQQRTELAQTRSAANELRQALRAATTRADSLQLVMDRAQDLIRRRDETREQQLLDELACMAAARKTSP